MFYVKSKIADGCEIKIDLEDNIYNLCPACGKETKVDLADVFEVDGNLYDSQVRCEDCSRHLNPGEVLMRQAR